MHVGELPVLLAAVQRLRIVELFQECFPKHGNHKIEPALLLSLLVFNITCSRQPLYELADWASQIDPRLFGRTTAFSKDDLSDDQFGRALDLLYRADRASMMTLIVLTTIVVAKIQLDQLHNDSTSVKAYGSIPGKTKSGLELKHGHSKDHRPDLKQLVFTLTITRDGAVPVHYKAYPGNTTDDKTHIETWTKLVEIAGSEKFLYVADCKVCTDEQLFHIAKQHDGRVVTVMPKTWKESKSFLDTLRQGRAPTKVALRKRKIRSNPERYDCLSYFEGEYLTQKRGFKLHWIHSSEKQRISKIARERRLIRAEAELSDLICRLNRRKLKTRTAIDAKVKRILKVRQVSGLIDVVIGEVIVKERVQEGAGRPGPNTVYHHRLHTQYTLSVARSKSAIEVEEKADGVFPLLSTDATLTTREVLDAYKFQPRLEKRFCQFKSVHGAAPLLFKKIERVEAIMFLFFIALIVQAFIEREIRKKMKERGIESIPLYPEERAARRPTTTKVLARFEQVSTYRLEDERGTLIQEFRDELSPLQQTLLELLDINQHAYWPRAA